MKTMLLTAAVLATISVTPALAASTAPPTDPMNNNPTPALSNSGHTNGNGAGGTAMRHKRVVKASAHRVHRKPMKKKMM